MTMKPVLNILLLMFYSATPSSFHYSNLHHQTIHSFPTRRSSDLNQSAAFSSGKVRPNHETNINIIARRTGKDVNSHTVLDGIITTIMATIQRINIIGSREGSYYTVKDCVTKIGRAVQQECRDRSR